MSETRRPELEVLAELLAAHTAAGIESARHHLRRAADRLSHVDSTATISSDFLRMVHDNYVLTMPFADIEVALRVGRAACDRSSGVLLAQQLSNLLLLLTDVGHLDEATALVPRLTAAAGDLRDPFALGATAMRIAFLELARDDVAAARARLARAEQIAEQVGSVNLAWSIALVQSSCDLREDRPGDAVRRLSSYLETADGDRLRAMSAWRWARARRLTGDPDPALTRRVLDEARARLWRGAAWGLPDLLASDIELAVAHSGQADRARRLRFVLRYGERITLDSRVRSDLNRMEAELDSAIGPSWRDENPA